MSIHSRVFASGMLLLAARAGAQQPGNCQGIPGTPFGILAISCPSCTMKGGNGARRTVSFFGEPVVLETKTGSGFVVGDIIEAVNGRPITTAAAADQLSFPPVGANEISVRRGRDRHVVAVTVSAADGACAPAGSSRDDSLAALTKRTRGLLDNIAGRDPSIVMIDGVFASTDIPASRSDPRTAGGYGFAVACAPSCTAATGSEGKTTFPYYRYGGYPPIIAVRTGGPADRAGIKVGDVILKVDGVSILEDAAAQQLGSVHRKAELRLTVLHDNKEVDCVLRLP